MMAILLHAGGSVLLADNPKADLGSGTYAYQVYDNDAAGPDSLHVKSNRTIKATGPCFAFPDDGIEITETNNQGKDIHAATATGRSAGDKIFYTVQGEFITEGTGGGGGRGVKTWEAEYGTASVDIIAVPAYLYADATAAVPVKFQVKDLGDQVELTEVTVRFYVDAFPAFEYNATQSFAAAHTKTATWHVEDGMGATSGNGTTDTYIAWIPITAATFKHGNCDVQRDTTSNAVFVVKVKAKTVGSEMSAIAAASKIDDSAARPTVFGDKEVEVIEIEVNGDQGVGEQWSVMKAATKQAAIHRQAAIQADHLWNSLNGGGPWGGKMHPYKIATGRQGVLALDWDDCIMEVLRSDTIRETKTWLKDEWSSTGEFTHKVRIKVTGETIGCYFGVSWPHHSGNVPVLGGPGMRLDKNSGVSNITLFNSGKATAKIEDADGDNSLGMTLASTAFSIGGALATGGWSIALNIASAALSLASDLTSPQPEGAGHAAIHFIWMDQLPGQANPTRTQIHSPYEATNNFNPPEASPREMNRTSVPLVVGGTYVGHVVLNTAICKTSANWYTWCQIWGSAKYFLDDEEWSGNTVTVYSVITD